MRCSVCVDETPAGIGLALAVKLLELGNTVSLLGSSLALIQHKSTGHRLRAPCGCSCQSRGSTLPLLDCQHEPRTRCYCAACIDVAVVCRRPRKQQQHNLTATVRPGRPSGSQNHSCGRCSKGNSPAPPAASLVTALLKLSQADRDSLVATVVADYPGFNVLINNAGVQKKVHAPLPHPSPPHPSSFSLSPQSLPLISPRVKIKIADTFDMEEMTINFEAPVHLCHLAIQHIQGKPNATM